MGTVNQIALTALIGVGIFGLLVWSIKGYVDLRSKTPRAACGFITAVDLEDHCQRMQAGCTAILAIKLESIASSLKDRLQNGDKLLDDHTHRLSGIEKSMAGHVVMLQEISRRIEAKIG